MISKTINQFDNLKIIVKLKTHKTNLRKNNKELNESLKIINDYAKRGIP